MKSIWSCDTPVNKRIPANSTFVLPYVWSYIPEGGLTESKDIKVRCKKEVSLEYALEILEQCARGFVVSQGAKDIRQYYIEEVKFKDAEIIFNWGT